GAVAGRPPAPGRVLRGRGGAPERRARQAPVRHRAGLVLGGAVGARGRSVVGAPPFDRRRHVVGGEGGERCRGNCCSGASRSWSAAPAAGCGAPCPVRPGRTSTCSSGTT